MANQRQWPLTIQRLLPNHLVQFDFIHQVSLSGDPALILYQVVQCRYRLSERLEHAVHTVIPQMIVFVL
jgi:hypothetical protein